MIRHLAAALISILFGVAVSKADVQYNVDRPIGSASAVGFIDTDGSTGSLTQSDITSWNLKLTDGTSTWDLLGPLNGNNSVVYLLGSDLTASATQLLFNFSAADTGIFLLQTNLFSGSTYYCDATFNGACLQGESIVPGSYPAPGFANAFQIGNQVIGTVSSVPEPGYFYAMALLGAALAVRRRSHV